MQTIKKVFSPPLEGFLIGLVLVMLDVKLPDFLVMSFQYVGNMATPLSLIVIGIEIIRVKYSDNVARCMTDTTVHCVIQSMVFL